MFVLLLNIEFTAVVMDNCHLTRGVFIEVDGNNSVSNLGRVNE